MPLRFFVEVVAVGMLTMMGSQALFLCSPCQPFTCKHEQVYVYINKTRLI